ncbi:MAG: HEAT repeat domain-containing protein [Cyanobacteria bacterium J06592_8]
MASTVESLPLSTQATDALILAQEDSTSAPQKLKRFIDKLPMGLILLTVGSVIATGGAVFIMMKLIGQQSEPEEEEQISEQLSPNTTAENSSPYLTQPQLTQPQLTQPQNQLQNIAIPQSSASPFQAEDAEVSTATPTEKNGSVNVPHPPQDSQKSQEIQEKSSIPPQTHSDEQFLIADRANVPKLDRVEQLILGLQNQDPVQRNRIVWELGQKADSRAIQPLVDLIYSSDSKQRGLILAALSEIGTRTLKPMSRALTLSLQDENAEVRKNAIRDLTRIYDLVYQMNQLLQRAADDPDAEVRETAKWAADKLSRIRPLPTIHDEHNR